MPHEIDSKLTTSKKIKLFLKGMCMGAADVIPGVSGGTIAFLMGIYEDWIQALRSIDLELLKDIFTGRFKDALNSVAWQFLFILLAGILTSIVCLAKVIEFWMEHYPIYLNAFFFGLIAATIPIIAKIMKNWNPFKFVLVVVSALAAYFIVQMVPLKTPDASWFLFLSGAIAISAMILPGISGSFLLLILGKYQQIIQAINDRDIATLAVFATGVAVGILSFVRLLSWLFKKYHDETIALLTGLVIGSLDKIWPWKETLEWMKDRHGELVPMKQINVFPEVFNQEFIIAISIMLAGFGLAFLLNRSPDDGLGRLAGDAHD